MTVANRCPRQWAQEILRLPLDQQADALAKVPARTRGVVAHYVRDWPVRFRAAIEATAKRLHGAPPAVRATELREMPAWRRRRIQAALEALATRCRAQL